MVKKQRRYKYLVGDFETTVYKGQESTEVWASAIVQLGTEDVFIFNSIQRTYQYLLALDTDIILYYHNLKFDGHFWLYYILHDLKYPQAVEQIGQERYQVKFLHDEEMPVPSFKYSISDLGQWYTIIIMLPTGKKLEIRDSLKLLPFPVRKIGKDFQTKHKKLDMEYEGYRYAGGEITEEEKKYIANDVLVVKEALEIMFSEGHKKLTIGSCCFDEFKKTFFKEEFDRFFPDLYQIILPQEKYGSKTLGEYIRRSYKGGWCYLVKGKENKIYNNGTTADVNSLYPSVMSSESGNAYPVGLPKIWVGEIPKFILSPCNRSNYYFFVRIRTRFKLKKNFLPCIQVKGNFLYSGTEWLETSDIRDKKGFYHTEYVDLDGKTQQALVTLTLTQTDYFLIKDHYELYDTEYLDGCYFSTFEGLFDMYIEKYKQLKLVSEGAKRELAKLFLNNLYGKLATSIDSSFKYCYLRDDDTLSFVCVNEYDKKAGYIPIGSAITSYARNFTIRAAQKNYYGPDKRGFIYADTDSIHCDLKPEELKGVKVDPKNFCCWKLESNWDKAIFVRQKTYIEHITHENLKPIDEPYYSIRCAGMPDSCKNLLSLSLEKMTAEEWEDKYKDYWDTLTEQDKEFITTPRDLTDFKVGLMIHGKLLPKRIKGGILLTETTYELR